MMDPNASASALLRTRLQEQLARHLRAAVADAVAGRYTEEATVERLAFLADVYAAQRVRASAQLHGGHAPCER
jgi:hypothetical protein